MNIFKFKQFEVDQSGCAMKINTDGVLLAAMVEAEKPLNILDIGTGTGVLAMMMAQRFEKAKVVTVEIDKQASETAKRNFQSSVFNNRLSIYNIAFEKFHTIEKFDLIISNPPFFVNDLKNPEEKKGIARHTNEQFFKELVQKVEAILTTEGKFWFILPVKQAKNLISDFNNVGLTVSKKITLHSDESKPAFRWIICLSRFNVNQQNEHFYIYQSEKVYTKAYRELLKDFFLDY